MITTRDVEYEVDGETMVGRLALPEGSGRRPGVLIGHEGIGLNDFQRGRADALAELGYVAFAMDFAGGRWLPDPDERRDFLLPLLGDTARMRAAGRAALDVLRDRTDDVAAVGYGTGGTILLELGRDGAGLRAIAGVNAVLTTPRPQDAANIRCPVLMCVGSEDGLVTAEQRDAYAAEMSAAGVDWQLIVCGGAEHVFHHPPMNRDGSLVDGDTSDELVAPGVSYHEKHAWRAWRAVLDLLAETVPVPA